MSRDDEMTTEEYNEVNAPKFEKDGRFKSLCMFCDNVEYIAIYSEKTKACLCFTCMGGSLTQMGERIQENGKVDKNREGNE